jgi:hypothetical protein
MLALNEDHAVRYGLKEAIILHKIIYYVLLNEKDGRNYHKGKHWTFNSRGGWRSIFPFFSDMQIWRTLKNLEKQSVLVSDSFNRMAYDKTRWYSLSPSMLKEVKQDKSWTKAVYKSVKASNKTAITHNKTATPIPVYNNNTINIQPF